MISVPCGTGDISSIWYRTIVRWYMPSAYAGTDIISCLRSKYIIRQHRISYRISDISLKNTTFCDIIKPKGVIRLKIHGVKREWSKPFWVRFKKHYCPSCMNLLTTTKVSKIINSNSEEAKDYDFSSGDTYMIGNIKFIWTEFLCTACGKTYSLQEIRENEKKTK